MKKHSLSIVIPCFNIIENDKYLNELLKKISDQKENIFYIQEIILVNDSPQFNLIDFIVEENKLDKLKIITNNVNRGQAFSRNIGLNEVNSDFVHFIDQDDLIDEKFYSQILEVNDIIITNCFLFNQLRNRKHLKFTKDLFLSLFSKIKNLRFFLIFDNIVLSPGQIIIKKDVLVKINGFPILESYGSDDYGMMYNLSFTNLNYSYFKKSIFSHRLHEIQGKRFLDMNRSRNEFLTRYNKRNYFFNFLCRLNIFPFNLFKKVLYLLFYNRI